MPFQSLTCHGGGGVGDKIKEEDLGAFPGNIQTPQGWERVRACLRCTASPSCLTAQIKFHTSLPRASAHAPETHAWDKIKICAIYARIKHSARFTLPGFQKAVCRFTNGRTQHILTLFRNSDVLLSQESVIYPQSH